MINASAYKPKAYPYGSTVLSANIDRVQDMSISDSLNRTKIEEVGREGLVDWRKTTPNVNVTIRQLEYGSLEFIRRLANVEDSVNKIEFTDFKTSQIDIAAYKTDDSGTYLSTSYFPNQRISGLGLDIGDPDALLERNITLVGEQDIQWQNDNKYLIPLSKTTISGETGDVDIVIGSGDYANYPDPVLDPDTSSTYILKVTRIRSGVATEMAVGSSSGEYEYDSGTTTITVHGAAVDDTYKAYYTATTYITGSEPFTANDSDLAGITADSVSIYLESSNYLYRLQSCSLDLAFDRFDIREIGNQNIVSRGVRDVTASVTLGRIEEQLTIEEVLRGVSSSYGKIDIKEFTDELNLIVKIYDSPAKNSFLMGYKITDLAPTALDGSAAVDDYIQRNNTFEGESGFISVTEGDF